MNDFKYPNEVYGVISEFDDEEQLAMALIVARKELDRTRKALDVANAVIMDYAKEKLEKKEEK